jgi:hypothetical protein
VVAWFSRNHQVYPSVVVVLLADSIAYSPLFVALSGAFELQLLELAPRSVEAGF